MAGPDLRAFILRSEVLHLYRHLLRAAKGAQDTASRGAPRTCGCCRRRPARNALSKACPDCSCLNPSRSPRPSPPAAELRGEIRRQFEAQRWQQEPTAIRFLLSDGAPVDRQMDGWME